MYDSLNSSLHTWGWTSMIQISIRTCPSQNVFLQKRPNIYSSTFRIKTDLSSATKLTLYRLIPWKKSTKLKRTTSPFSGSCNYDNKSHHPIRQLTEPTACVNTRVYIFFSCRCQVHSRELNILMHTVHNARENETNEVNWNNKQRCWLWII